jgi:hypothetical protein
MTDATRTTGASRRRALALLASAPALAIAPAAAQGAHPDVALLDLGRRLGEAWAFQRAVFDGEIPHGDWDGVYAASLAIVHEIEEIRATSLAGLLVKAKAFLFCTDTDPITPEELSGHTTELRLALGIAADLLALA